MKSSKLMIKDNNVLIPMVFGSQLVIYQYLRWALLILTERLPIHLLAKTTFNSTYLSLSDEAAGSTTPKGKLGSEGKAPARDTTKNLFCLSRPHSGGPLARNFSKR